MTGPWYSTVEEIKIVHNIEYSSLDASIYRLLGGGTLKAESLVERKFMSYYDTKHYSFPSMIMKSASYRLWLEADLLSVTALNGVSLIPSDSCFLEPAYGNVSGPPYRWIEVNKASSYFFGGGTTSQQAVSIEGLWGYTDATVPAGRLTTAITTTTETIIYVSDASYYTGIGIGNTILIGTEHMFVSSKDFIDSTVILNSDLTGDVGATGSTMDASDGSLLHKGEVIAIDSEEMLILGIIGNSIRVQRHYNDTLLADHDTGSTVFVPRKLTVQRNADGSTAATHLINATITAFQPPEDIKTLTMAYVIMAMMEEDSGYGKDVGAGSAARRYDGRSVKKMEADVISTYGIRRVGGI